MYSGGFRYTATANNQTIYANGTAFPATANGTLSKNRPNIKIVKEAPFELFKGYNLAVLFLTPPVYDTADLCSLSTYSPIKVVLTNHGENNYDFSINSIELEYEFIEPSGTKTIASMPIQTGILKSKEIDTFDLFLPVVYAGRYEVNVRVVSPLDNYKHDDSASVSFTSGRIGLPLDEYFKANVMPSEFISTALVGTDVWEIFHPNSTFPVQPDSAGTGMIRYEGARGNLARLTSRPLDLHGSLKPKLEFWYYHDTTASPLDDSYTDVNVIVDGIPARLLTVYRRDTVHGWHQHSVYLSSYPADKCVLLQFESMNKSNLPVAQYIDHLFITSEQDLQVEEILVSPQISSCEMDGKNIYAVIRTTTNHTINFLQYPTSLLVKVPNYPVFNYPLAQLGSMGGNSVDTILIASNIRFGKGKDSITAFLSVPIDNFSGNDTAKAFVIDINPSLSASIRPITNETKDCILKGISVQQDVTVKNIGNMDISEVAFIFNVENENANILHQIRDTIHGTIIQGDSAKIKFTYETPSESFYYVYVTAYLSCDSTLTTSKTSIRECVDMDDLLIQHFVKPQAGTTDIAGTGNQVEVLIKNASKYVDFTDVIIRTRIEDADGEVINNLEFGDVIANIRALDSVSHVFTKSYIVPNVSSYFIRVFLGSRDNYPQNDTLRQERHTGVGVNSVISEVFTVGQNIPNPAKNSTQIAYSIPSSGEVEFKVQTVSGQILHTEVLQSDAGKQFIELNTTNFAAGVYFYSIEYRGQKIVKRMSVKD
jgi:hypothetical protein